MRTVEIAKKVFERIQTQSSHLKMIIEEQYEYVDIAMNIKKQTGLDFDVFLSLQNNDELHLQLESFHGDWFPCTEPTCVSEYEAVVNGVLTGSFRVKVINRRGRPVKAFLQTPSENEWSTIFTWGKLHLPLGAKTISYVQNQTHNKLKPCG